jgi:PTH1 family peptidyl-tRNA hydrolase
MNLSGQAVKPLAASLGVQPEEILVASDDLDLPLGQIRLRAGGGAGGHRGVASIIENLGSPDFARLRMGIGRPPQDMDVVDYVLRRFDQEDGAVARDMIENAAAAAVTWVEVGITEAMNRYNRKLAADARHEEGE